MNKEIIYKAVSWDVVNWSKAVNFWEQHLPANFEGMRALELGGGDNCGLSLWLASKGADVVCSGYKGISEAAKNTHREYGYQKRISYEIIDALNIPYENEFDLICFKSMLGGIVREGRIGTAEKVMSQIHKALRSRGKLVFAENLYATELHAFLRSLFGAGKNKWRYFTVEEMNMLTESFTNQQFGTYGVSGLFGFNEKARNCLGVLDTLLLEKITGHKSRYIYGAVCEKS